MHKTFWHDVYFVLLRRLMRYYLKRLAYLNDLIYNSLKEYVMSLTQQSTVRVQRTVRFDEFIK